MSTDSPSGPGSAPDGPESIARRAWSIQRQWRVAGAIFLALVIAAVVVWLSGNLFAAKAPPAAVHTARPGTFRASAQQFKTFTVESVRMHAFVSEEFTEGKIGINGDRATPVVSPYSGRVTRVIAGLGDTVRAGAALATVEASEFAQAQGDLKVAFAQARIARINESRKHALFDAKGGSLQDWQQAQSDLSAAQTAVNAVHNRLRILGVPAAKITQLEAAENINPEAALKAPIAGVVVDRQLGPGQFLQANGAPVFVIADPSSVWLLANVREADTAAVRVGQIIEVHVLAYPERVFKARINQVSAVIDPTTHRLPVRAEIDNRDGALKPEMFATFRILTSQSTDSPAIAQSAVIYEGEAAHVWMVMPDDLITYRAVRTGRTSDGLVEVLDGLQVDERVVTKGGLFIDQEAVPGS